MRNKNYRIIILSVGLFIQNSCFGLTTKNDYDIFTSGLDFVYYYHDKTKTPIEEKTFINNIPGDRWVPKLLIDLKYKYQYEKNDFKKKDILDKSTKIIQDHKPEFTSRFQAYWSGLNIGRYDFDKKSYSVNAKYLHMNRFETRSYKTILETTSIEYEYFPKSEKEARQIEEFVLKKSKKMKSNDILKNGRFLRALFVFEVTDTSEKIEKGISPKTKKEFVWKNYFTRTRIVRVDVYPNYLDIENIDLKNDLLFSIKM